MIIKKRHPLSSKEQKELLEKVKEQYPSLCNKLDRKKVIEVIETAKENKIYIQEGRPIFFGLGGRIVPCLRASQEFLGMLPRVVVDMGAVPHIINGADVMSPGIREIADEVKAGEVVVVVEERYGKPIAVGRLLMDSKEIQCKKRGKAVENLHHVGDDIWNFGDM